MRFVTWCAEVSKGSRVQWLLSWFFSSVTHSHLHWCVCSLSHAGYVSNITARTNYDYTTYDPSAVDFECGNYSYYLSDCSFTATSNYSCQSHQYDAYLTCTIGMNLNFTVFQCCVCKLSAYQFNTLFITKRRRKYLHIAVSAF